ncbi:MAG: dTMP kinase [Hyphomicrobium sp.]
MNRGKFITFEGGEGSGKSTQARLLAEALRAKGHDVVVTREPGGTPLGESIRELILANRPALDAEFLLFAAARAEHVAQKILPALEAGRWVVCDRYIDSTRVYQGKLAGVDAHLIDVVELHTSRAVWPALTIVLDVPPATGRARASERGELNRYDAENLSYHDKIRQGFLDIAAEDPDRCVVIDGSRPATAVAAAVCAAVSTRLGVET